MDRALAEVTEQRLGLRPDRVNCPGDLPRVIGAQVACDVIKGGGKVGTATVILDGYTHVRYTVDVDLSELSSQASVPPGPTR